MRLTTKSRYAVNALTELSFLQSTGPVSLSDISTNQNIELSYLEQIFRKLRIAGIVKSKARGEIPDGSTVVVTVTGHGLKDPATAIENSNTKSLVVESDIQSVLDAIGIQ